MSRRSLSPRLLLGRRWWWTTLLVLAGIAVMARLGVWQLDRLAERQAINAITRAELEQPPLDLNAIDPQTLSVAGGDFRQVTARGTFDIANQVLLAQQRYGGRLGNHLLTPLRLEEREAALLVDRGWVPATDDGGAGWPDYPAPGPITVVGYLRASEARPASAAAGEPRAEWFRVDVAGIAAQLPYPLLPYYVLAIPATESPTGAPAGPPFRETPEPDLSNGPHLGYAVQWFIFSLLLGGGYLYYVARHEAEPPQAMDVTSRSPASR